MVIIYHKWLLFITGCYGPRQCHLNTDHLLMTISRSSVHICQQWAIIQPIVGSTLTDQFIDQLTDHWNVSLSMIKDSYLGTWLILNIVIVRGKQLVALTDVIGETGTKVWGNPRGIMTGLSITDSHLAVHANRDSHNGPYNAPVW